MTKAEATALRVKRKQQGDLSQCEHRPLSLEEVDLRDSTERYDCMECGEPVAHKPQEPVSR